MTTINLATNVNIRRNRHRFVYQTLRKQPMLEMLNDSVTPEFPRIRIDYFRPVPGHPPPLACFLSHVHTDHLQGLETLKSPFVYCSPATREILLRLEKYPHRINFAKGIVECRKQTYRGLKSIVKSIPLDTPTNIELCPGYEIRVTLLDANHCIGAVMFLIEGSDGTTILYTGDIRAERWWVDSLLRKPLLVPFTYGPRRLDKVYLDTTFATKSNPYLSFPDKSEGISELLDQVAKHPADTVFHFQAWTFGYEDVWIALSAALRTPIHLDPYRWRLYNSLDSRGSATAVPEAAALCGFSFGNRFHAGCLTKDPSVRLHSCEKGNPCPVFEKKSNAVQIIPIVNRLANGVEIPELGAGGGQGDLDQIHELELGDTKAVQQLIALCKAEVDEPTKLSKVLALLLAASGSEQNMIRLEADEWKEKVNLDNEGGIEASLKRFVSTLAREAEEQCGDTQKFPVESRSPESRESPYTPLARTINFPYSRHSSYSELRYLIKVLRPRDVHPCTVDEDNWNEDLSMRTLFGEFCSGKIFAHDELMRTRLELRNESESTRRKIDSSLGLDTQDSQNDSSQNLNANDSYHCEPQPIKPSTPSETGQAAGSQVTNTSTYFTPIAKDSVYEGITPLMPTAFSDASSEPCQLTTRQWAYLAALEEHDGLTWSTFGGLTCARDNHSEMEIEL